MRSSLTDPGNQGRGQTFPAGKITGGDEVKPHRPGKSRAGSILADQMNGRAGVAGRGQEFIYQVLGPDLQAAGAYAGVAADVLIPQHILVDQEGDLLVFVIHQPHDADGARLNIEIFEHGILPGKGEAGGVDLGGELLCLELFVSRHHEQVEIRLLPVAEEEILAHQDTENGIDLVTGLHVVGALMIRPLIVDLQGIQKIIGTYFTGKAAGQILRPSAV